MSHWNGFKIKVWANTRTTPSHSMTPDTHGLRPSSFHDNTVGAQEKTQCTELEASIQAMKWEVGNMSTVSWAWTQGPQIGRKETQKGCLKEQLWPSINTHIGPFALSWQSIYGRAAEPKASFSFLSTGSLLWQSRLTKLTGMPHLYLWKQTETLLKNSLVISEASNKTVPLEKSAHDTLQPGMSSGISQGRACFQK